MEQWGEKDGINGGYDGNHGEHYGKNGEILHEHIHVVDFLRFFFGINPVVYVKKNVGKNIINHGILGYPISRYIQLFGLCNKHNYGKSHFLMGKLTINGDFQ